MLNLSPALDLPCSQSHSDSSLRGVILSSANVRLNTQEAQTKVNQLFMAKKTVVTVKYEFQNE